MYCNSKTKLDVKIRLISAPACAWLYATLLQYCHVAQGSALAGAPACGPPTGGEAGGAGSFLEGVVAPASAERNAALRFGSRAGAAGIVSVPVGPGPVVRTMYCVLLVENHTTNLVSQDSISRRRGSHKTRSRRVGREVDAPDCTVVHLYAHLCLTARPGGPWWVDADVEVDVDLSVGVHRVVVSSADESKTSSIERGGCRRFGGAKSAAGLVERLYSVLESRGWLRAVA